MTDHSALASLGWSAFYLSQLDLSDLDLTPARLAEVHRDRMVARTAAGVVPLVFPGWLSAAEVAVGDWVLADAQGRVAKLLDRRSCLSRAAPGGGTQLIAANVETLLVASSCSADFNPARLERYLAAAASAGAAPVVVLTKADLAGPAPFVAKAAGPMRGLPVVALDARAPGDALADWLRPGQTVALCGMSGVGKTTLSNALTGGAAMTAATREDDARGRHTTTFRGLHPLPGGAWLIDTPGMRELGLVGAAEGLAATFADIADLAQGCRFNDCRHQGEPGCAVAAAVAAGALDEGRLRRWHKLAREDARLTETAHARRAHVKAFGRRARAILGQPKRSL
jgi:ribosome biogenesis GTPase